MTSHVFMLQLENGKVDFEITLKQLEDILPPPYSYYDKTPTKERLIYKKWLFSAKCVDKLTGKVLVKNDSVRVEGNKFMLSWLPSTPSNFKPGLIYNAYVSIVCN